MSVRGLILIRGNGVCLNDVAHLSISTRKCLTHKALKLSSMCLCLEVQAESSDKILELASEVPIRFLITCIIADYDEKSLRFSYREGKIWGMNLEVDLKLLYKLRLKFKNLYTKSLPAIYTDIDFRSSNELFDFCCFNPYSVKDFKIVLSWLDFLMINELNLGLDFKFSKTEGYSCYYNGKKVPVLSSISRAFLEHGGNTYTISKCNCVKCISKVSTTDRHEILDMYPLSINWYTIDKLSRVKKVTYFNNVKE